MNLISKYSKEFRFLLCVMTFIVNMRGFFSQKSKMVVELQMLSKMLSIFLDESNCKYE